MRNATKRAKCSVPKLDCLRGMDDFGPQKQPDEVIIVYIFKGVGQIDETHRRQALKLNHMDSIRISLETVHQVWTPWVEVR